MSYWKGCAVTGADCIPLLKASHIKPWCESNNKERLDVFNGLLLSPNIDAAFDTGYITFDLHGKIVLSNAIAAPQHFNYTSMQSYASTRISCAQSTRRIWDTIAESFRG